MAGVVLRLGCQARGVPGRWTSIGRSGLAGGVRVLVARVRGVACQAQGRGPALGAPRRGGGGGWRRRDGYSGKGGRENCKS